MSSNHGYGPDKKRKMLEKWDENNIFGDGDTDMMGIMMDEDNIESVHHVFDRYGNCVGVACLSRYIHDYLDFHLKFQDKEEYYVWNEYLKDVYEYVTNNVRMISLDELMVMRTKLLDYIRTDNSDKFKGRTKIVYLRIKGKLKPYLSNDICDIYSLYRGLSNIYRIIPENDLPVDVSSAASNLIRRIFPRETSSAWSTLRRARSFRRSRSG